MPYKMRVDKLEPDGTIRIRHTFYDETIEGCERRRDEHAGGCQSFGPALKAEKIIQTVEEIDEIPEWATADDDDD